MRRRARPRPGDPGSAFRRWVPPPKPAEEEGPPIPPHIDAERLRQAWGDDDDTERDA